MSKVQYDTHYDEDYFYPHKKIWYDQYDQPREYLGPAKDWEGFTCIASFLRDHLPDALTIHDVGCSAGSFVARATPFGFECTGVDVSRYAVRECLPAARGKLKLLDITRVQPAGQADLVTAMDLMEHIYLRDLEQAIQYILSAIKPGGVFFACICTIKSCEAEWAHTGPEDEIPREWAWAGVAGHVHLKSMSYWISKFESVGLTTMYDMMAKFQLWREWHEQMRAALSWGILNVYIGRKG